MEEASGIVHDGVVGGADGRGRGGWSLKVGQSALRACLGVGSRRGVEVRTRSSVGVWRRAPVIGDDGAAVGALLAV